MIRYVVVDASLVVKWLVTEEYSDRALALLRSWNIQLVRAAAPILVRFEVANVLHKRVVRGDISTEAALQHVSEFLTSGVEMRDDPEIHVRAVELAGRLRQGAAYDCHYLALAEVLDCELWTADRRFYRSAGRGIDRVRWIGELSTQAP